MPLLRTARATEEGGQTGRGTKKCGADWLAPRRVFRWIELQAAVAFFADFDWAFVGGFGVAFLVDLAFSFAANSCLTVAEMASTSTLYAVAASRRIFAVPP